MDLSTVESKVKNYSYNNDDEFNDDIRLIWKNAKLFNSPETEIYIQADKLEVETEQLF